MRTHTPKIDLARGVSLVFYCKRCGKPAYLDIGSAKTAHAERLPERMIRDASIASRLSEGPMPDGG